MSVLKRMKYNYEEHAQTYRQYNGKGCNQYAFADVENHKIIIQSLTYDFYKG